MGEIFKHIQTSLGVVIAVDGRCVVLTLLTAVEVDFLNLDFGGGTLLTVLFIAVDVDCSDECHHIALAEPIDDHICVAVLGGAGKEVGFGILLALALRAVAGNDELAKTALAFGLDFGIGSQSAGYHKLV